MKFRDLLKSLGTFIYSYIRPQGTLSTTGRSSFSVKGTQVYLTTTVGGKPNSARRFLAKGVCWLPLPLGADPSQPPYGDYMTKDRKSVWQADLDRMRAMGVNVVRCFAGSADASANYGDMMDYAWHGGNKPIYFFWYSYIPSGELVSHQDTYAKVYKTIAQNTASHPVTIGYCIGNELNFSQPGFAKAIETIARSIKSVRGISGNKLVTTALEDDGKNLPAVTSLLNDAPSIDVIAINVYRGENFGGALGTPTNIWTNYKHVARSKALPLLLTEWGTPYSTRQDSSDPTKISTNPNDKLVGLDAVTENPDGSPITTQADYIANQWHQILHEYHQPLSDSVGFGGTLFLWSDNWSSISPVDEHNADANKYTGAFAGGYWDNEWFGIHGLCTPGEATYNPCAGKPGYYTCPSKLGTYKPQPRPAVATLTRLWN